MKTKVVKKKVEVKAGTSGDKLSALNARELFELRSSLDEFIGQSKLKVPVTVVLKLNIPISAIVEFNNDNGCFTEFEEGVKAAVEEVLDGGYMDDYSINPSEAIESIEIEE